MSNQTPSPASLSHLRPTNVRGLFVLGGACAATTTAILLSARGGSWLHWGAGQIILGVTLVHWFTVLHESGHRTLFRSRRLNEAAGVLAGFLAMIPYQTWIRVHRRHHKWTGWQDLDPTAAGLVRSELRPRQRAVVNFCWRWSVPLFSVLYRTENYWNLPRLARMFPQPADRRAMLVGTSLQLAGYALIAVLAGPALILKAAFAGIVLSLVLEDFLLLSQHTLVPVQLSGGHAVPPVPAIDQATFTRSLRLPQWMSSLLLHFDAHELHHMYPFVPGYHLRRIPYSPPNEIGWWQWLKASKRIPGVTLLFHFNADN